MNEWINVAKLAVLVTLVTGCTQEKLGGGARTIVTGNTATESVYGLRAGQTLGFVMFTDIHSEGTDTAAGSSWTGHIKPTEGPAVVYKGSTDGLDINGAEYLFANGRVFLVSTQEGEVSAKQLKMPVGNDNYESEIGRLAELEEVQEFLNK